MKKYKSKLAQLPCHCLWCICLYSLLALIAWGLFYLSETKIPTYSFFLVILAICLGQCLRFWKLSYRIKGDALIQYDFQCRTLFIENIVAVRVLKKMKWVSFHIPYNIVIETKDKEKYYMAPDDIETLIQLLEEENPNIQIIRE